MDSNYSDDSEETRVLSALLKKETEYKLSKDFAGRVLSRAFARESRRDIFWLSAGIFLLVIAALVAVLLTGFKPNFGALRFLTGYQGLLGFGVALVLILNWAEKKWLRKPSF